MVPPAHHGTNVANRSGYARVSSAAERNAARHARSNGTEYALATRLILRRSTTFPSSNGTGGAHAPAAKKRTTPRKADQAIANQSCPPCQPRPNAASSAQFPKARRIRIGHCRTFVLRLARLCRRRRHRTATQPHVAAMGIHLRSRPARIAARQRIGPPRSLGVPAENSAEFRAALRHCRLHTSGIRDFQDRHRPPRIDHDPLRWQTRSPRRETLFVPIHEQGEIITVDVSTSQPLEVEAAFERDFQLMWPAALPGSYAAWDYTLHAFSFADDLNHYSAFVGSPEATDPLLRLRNQLRGIHRIFFPPRHFQNRPRIEIRSHRRLHHRPRRRVSHLSTPRCRSRRPAARRAEILRGLPESHRCPGFAGQRSRARLRLVRASASCKAWCKISRRRHRARRGLQSRGQRQPAGLRLVFRPRFDVVPLSL